MWNRSLALTRRALALAGLLATLSGAVAPVCVGMSMKPVAAEHCGDSKGREAPTPSVPDGSQSHHHAPIVCSMSICVAIPMAPATTVFGSVPLFSSILPVEVALASAIPQHTTPPPRS